MISICRRFEFHAAHHLPNHQGKCKNVHGHSYILEVEVTGGVQKAGHAKGMIIDFGSLKKIVSEKVIDLVDHKDLNLIWENPTAEVMVQEFSIILRNSLPRYILLQRIRLWETSNSYAQWRTE
jgi:6-pyruvoyltetrahydropterin/6-carboxytetrahydropterin synthase